VIGCDREGAGAPLVLLHGIGHHRQAWRPVMDHLAGEFDVLACDSPGFGASPPLPAGTVPTIPAYADAFAAFFAAQGLDRPHVAGNSMGGAIALELARRGVVRSAAAFAPAGFWTPRERRFCRASLLASARLPAAARPAMLALVGSGPGRSVALAQYCRWPARMPAGEARSMLRDAWAAPAFGPALDAFDHYTFSAPGELRGGVPLTVAWGDRDRLLPFARQAPRARRMLPWARHVTLGAGHLPYTDDPGAVAATVRLSAADAAPG
jgi:pimeloyl-ACP methyl ester carboxylesterase